METSTGLKKTVDSGHLPSKEQNYSVAVNHRDNKLSLTQAHWRGGVRTKIKRWAGKQSKMKPEQKTGI